MGAQTGLLVALVTLALIRVSVFGDTRCSKFRNLANGQTFFRYGGLMVIFRCHPGYKLHGHQTNSCVSGLWSRNLPVCVGSGCSHPGAILHGSSRMNEDGSWAEFSCNSGFRLHGPSMIYCKGRSWNSTNPVCKEADIMSSVSVNSLQNLNALSKHQVSVASKNPPHLHFSPVGDKAPEQPDLRLDQLLHAPFNMFQNERNNLTNPRANLTMHTQSSSDWIETTERARGFDSVAQTSRESPGNLGGPIFPDVLYLPSSSPCASSPVTSASSAPSSTQSGIKTPSNTSTDRRSLWKGFHHLPLTSASKPVVPFQTTCSNPRVPLHGTLYFHHLENPGPSDFKYYIQYACYAGYTLAHGDVNSYCQPGGVWSGVTPVCLDIDECLLPAAVTGCMFGCVNTPGSFHCSCPDGFIQLSAVGHCQDIDECAVNGELGPCMQRCHNSPGSYRCSCYSGHILAGDGHSCFAECPPGYRKQPAAPPQDSTGPNPKQECVDINECLENMCEWRCINLPGSHRCICPRGYALQGNGRHCKDIDECHQKNGGCSHVCVNRRGGFKCACPASHRLSPYSWKKCLPKTTAPSAG
ncbi:complement receptor type 1 isoform X1 [Fundulus heteroclitus]|uniref:complement receptor type 1 isoform X1 n=1 Tax=Fundulus heteroclitus TaxID=8078 RepID=UPI00165B6D36|nr:complement receptor type 1 isoform X1 [Fundulus heteroclitus]